MREIRPRVLTSRTVGHVQLQVSSGNGVVVEGVYIPSFSLVLSRITVPPRSPRGHTLMAGRFHAENICSTVCFPRANCHAV